MSKLKTLNLDAAKRAAQKLTQAGLISIKPPEQITPNAIKMFKQRANPKPLKRRISMSPKANRYATREEAKEARRATIREAMRAARAKQKAQRWDIKETIAGFLYVHPQPFLTRIEAEKAVEILKCSRPDSVFYVEQRSATEGVK